MQGPEVNRVALSATVGQLEVTVRGPLPEATRLLQHLQLFEAGPSPVDFAPSSHQQPVAPPAPVVESPDHLVSPSSSGPPRSPTPSSSVPAVQVHLQGSVPPLPIGGKREAERSFPQCPSTWVDRASSLGSSNLSPRSRVLRAWRAGQWARQVLQGHYATPLPSEGLRLASRFYVVVGGGDLRPALYRSFRDFNAAVGPLASSPSVSHGFPSELEARVYVDAAGLTWDSLHQ